MTLWPINPKFAVLIFDFSSINSFYFLFSGKNFIDVNILFKLNLLLYVLMFFFGEKFQTNKPLKLAQIVTERENRVKIKLDQLFNLLQHKQKNLKQMQEGESI